MIRRPIILAGKLLLSAGLIGLVAYGIDTAALLAALRDLPLSVVVEVLILLSIQPFVLAFRWHQIIRMLGCGLPLREAVRLTFVGLFFNQVLPTSFGGDALRFWGACRLGVDSLIAAGSVLIDRASGLVTVALMIAAALWAIGAGFEDDTVRFLLIVLAPAGLIGLFACAWADRLFARWIPRSVARILVALAGGLRKILVSPSASGRLLVLGALAWLPYFVAVDALARAMSVDLGLCGSIVAGGGSMLIAALPVSIGGWGVREVAMVALFGAMSAPAEKAFVVSVVTATLAIVVSLPGGLLWLTLRRKVPAVGNGSLEP